MNTDENHMKCPFCDFISYGPVELNRHIEDEHSVPILTEKSKEQS